MIKSMTGFGRSEYSNEDISIEVEIKTVNSRFLDISLKMPNKFNFFEDKIRKLINKYISRGRVEVFIKYAQDKADKNDILVDLETAIRMKISLQSIIDYTGINSTIYISDLLENEDILSYQAPEDDKEKLENIILNQIEESIKSLKTMREKEGENLSRVLVQYIDQIKKNNLEISAYSSDLTKEYRDKIKESIERLLEDKHPVDEMRLANEIVFYADKADIQEEINRMKSHIKLFNEVLQTDEPVGKKLEFITQEMLRETNTIGSKSNKDEITKLVIEQKTIIEKIKEQVQNIE